MSILSPDKEQANHLIALLFAFIAAFCQTYGYILLKVANISVETEDGKKGAKVFLEIKWISGILLLLFSQLFDFCKYPSFFRLKFTDNNLLIFSCCLLWRCAHPGLLLHLIHHSNERDACQVLFEGEF